MSKLKTFVLDNYRKLYFCFLINLFFFIVFNIFFYCRYHTVDDVFMEMIACGAYGSYDFHLVYINVVIGFFLKALYSISNVIPWYGIMHIVMAIICFSLILYVFFNRGNKYAICLSILTVFVASFEAYTRVQFTKTAAYLAIAGYLLIADSLHDQKWSIKHIAGILLILNSFMLRPGMFFACSAICLAFFVPVIYNCLAKKDAVPFKKLFVIGAVSLALVTSVFLIDKLAYSGEGWKYYKNFNEYTTQLEDINFPDYELYEKEYNEMGIDYEDYVLYSSIDHNDPDLFDMDKMQKVKQLQPYKTMNIDEFIEFLLGGFNKFFKERTVICFTFLYLWSLLLVLFGSKCEIENVISIIVSWCFAFAALFYTYCMHRWLDRTTISIILVLIFVNLFFVKTRDNRFFRWLSVLGSLVLVCMSLYTWKDTYKWNMDKWLSKYQINHEVLDEVYADQEHLYISRVSWPAWKSYYTPYDAIRKDSMANYSPLGDWLANSPLSVSVLNKYGVVNPYKDIIDNNKVYLIGDGSNLEPVITYIKKHYNSKAEAVLVRTVGPYEVYSIRTEPLQ